MAAPYIPVTDSGVDDWGNNFASLISAGPSTYGLTPTDAAAIQSAFDTYHNAFLLGGTSGRVPINPTTRTVVTVGDKNNSKHAFVDLARTYASQIRLNPGVTNPNKIALRLNLPNNTPSPIPAPTTVPILMFLGATPGQHTLRYADQLTPALRRKPPGVIGMQLFLGVDTTPILDPALCALYAVTTSQPVGITFSPADAGKVATYFGRWQNRGKSPGSAVALVGPFSAGINATIPAN